MKNIFERMLAVSDQVRTVEKNMTVGAGSSASYKAVSDFDVTLAVKKAEAEHGVYSYPVHTELLSQQRNESMSKDRYGNDKVNYQYVDEVHMVMRFVNVERPEEFVEVEGYGRGIDTADKSFGKASTYARKYCLLNAYKIATGEDPDKDASPSDDEPQPAAQQVQPAARKITRKAAQQQAPQPLPPAPAPKMTMDELLKEITGVIDEAQLRSLWDMHKRELTAEEQKDYHAALKNRQEELKNEAAG